MLLLQKSLLHTHEIPRPYNSVFASQVESGQDFLTTAQAATDKSQTLWEILKRTIHCLLAQLHAQINYNKYTTSAESSHIDLR